MFSLFSWAAIKIRSFVFKVQKNLSSRCLCFPDCDLLLSFLFFLSFYALINHSLDFHAISQLRQFFCDVKFEDLGCSQGLPIFVWVPFSKAFVRGCADANERFWSLLCHWKQLNPYLVYHHCASFISRAFSVFLSFHHLTSSNSHWF